jgi:hypothetical protein
MCHGENFECMLLLNVVVVWWTSVISEAWVLEVTFIRLTTHLFSDEIGFDVCKYYAGNNFLHQEIKV